MGVGIAILIVGILVIGIWVLVELKRLKHKIFAVFLICLILFSYIGGVVAFKDKDVDLKSVPGLIDASKIYFSWVGSVFSNVVTITSQAIHMDWGVNQTSEK